MSIKIRLAFTEEVLGTLPNKEDIYREFIASKAPDAATTEQEVAALGADAVAEKGTTVFPRAADGSPFLYDYQIKGFFKDACSMLARAGKAGQPAKAKPGKKAAATESADAPAPTPAKSKYGHYSAQLTAFKKIIDGLIFVYPREIPIDLHGMKMDYCQRPLRAQTAQGERVSLACSETCPAGSSIEFEVECMDPNHENAVREWLNYGKMRGIGQWRNSSKGRFEWEEIKD